MSNELNEEVAKQAVRGIGKALATGLVTEFPKRDDRETAYATLVGAAVMLQQIIEGMPEGERRGGIKAAVCMIQGFAEAFDTDGEFSKELSDIKNSAHTLSKFL